MSKDPGIKTEHGGSTQMVFHRVWQTDQSEKGTDAEFRIAVKDAINWNSEETINQTSFEHQGETYYCVYSQPTWYAELAENFKQVDLLVISDSEDTAIYRFNQQREHSEERRLEAQHAALPILDELKDISSIKAAVGRGSVYDRRRITEPIYTDVDIMLFTEGDFPTEGWADNIVTAIQEIALRHPELDFTYAVYGKGFTGRDIRIRKTERPESITIGLDIIALEMVRPIVNLPRNPLSPYETDTLLNSVPLFDRSEGEFERMRWIIEEKNRRKIN